MFDILKIELEDFKSYVGAHSFKFPSKAGLYHLTGLNKKRKRLGPNGAGKTSLLDGIKWCLYGSTTRHLRSTDVVTWGKKSCAVTVKLNIDGREEVISRTHGPISLKLNGQLVEQHAINKLLRLNEEAFTYSVIIPQFGKSFFDLSPTQKLTVFSQIMELDFWLDKSKLANTTLSVLKEGILTCTSTIEHSRDRLKGLKEEIEDLADKERKHTTEADKKISFLREQNSEYTADLKQCESRVETVTKSVNRLRAELKDLQDGFQECHKARQMAADVLAQVRASMGQIRAEITAVGHDIEGVEALGPVCDTCNQPIDAKHKAKQVAAHNKKLDSLTDKLADSEKLLTKHKNKVDSFDADYDKFRKLISKVTDDLNEAINKKSKTEFAVKNIERSITDNKQLISETEKKSNPYSSLIESKEQTLSKLKKQLAEAKTQLEQLNAEAEAVGYWVNGFKRIRLFIIEQALTSLEIEVNNHLTTLGLTDWRIEFDVERENKTGGISKGFTVFIYSPDHNKPVKWESWSGGETQRLRLAGDLGLANLIMERIGLRSCVEFHDEPSEHMAVEGIEDMLETLHERAHETGRKIWVVDHQAFGFGDFSGKLTVVKDKNGSNIQFDN